jgi:hypothetical protein
LLEAFISGDFFNRFEVLLEVRSTTVLVGMKEMERGRERLKGGGERGGKEGKETYPDSLDL